MTTKDSNEAPASPKLGQKQTKSPEGFAQSYKSSIFNRFKRADKNKTGKILKFVDRIFRHDPVFQFMTDQASLRYEGTLLYYVHNACTNWK